MAELKVCDCECASDRCEGEVFCSRDKLRRLLAKERRAHRHTHAHLRHVQQQKRALQQELEQLKLKLELAKECNEDKTQLIWGMQKHMFRLQQQADAYTADANTADANTADYRRATSHSPRTKSPKTKRKVKSQDLELIYKRSKSKPKSKGKKTKRKPTAEHSTARAPHYCWEPRQQHSADVLLDYDALQREMVAAMIASGSAYPYFVLARVEKELMKARAKAQRERAKRKALKEEMEWELKRLAMKENQSKGLLYEQSIRHQEMTHELLRSKQCFR